MTFPQVDHLVYQDVLQARRADSKFFRSLVVVLVILFAVWVVEGQRRPAGTAIVLLLMVLWRYMDQRLKATNQAYWSVIAIVARDGKPVLSPPPLVDPAPCAGGVVFRFRWGTRKYLLVEATDRPNEVGPYSKEWVLPKGHWEPGESLPETAICEVHEESGFCAKIVGDLGVVTFTRDGKPQPVRFYLMRFAGKGFKSDTHRRRSWLPLERAVQQASYRETRELLKKADVRLHAKPAESTTSS